MSHACPACASQLWPAAALLCSAILHDGLPRSPPPPRTPSPPVAALAAPIPTRHDVRLVRPQRTRTRICTRTQRNLRPSTPRLPARRHTQHQHPPQPRRCLPADRRAPPARAASRAPEAHPPRQESRADNRTCSRPAPSTFEIYIYISTSFIRMPPPIPPAPPRHRHPPPSNASASSCAARRPSSSASASGTRAAPASPTTSSTSTAPQSSTRSSSRTASASSSTARPSSPSSAARWTGRRTRSGPCRANIPPPPVLTRLRLRRFQLQVRVQEPEHQGRVRVRRVLHRRLVASPPRPSASPSPALYLSDARTHARTLFVICMHGPPNTVLHLPQHHPRPPRPTPPLLHVSIPVPSPPLVIWYYTTGARTHARSLAL